VRGKETEQNRSGDPEMKIRRETHIPNPQTRSTPLSTNLSPTSSGNPAPANTTALVPTANSLIASFPAAAISTSIEGTVYRIIPGFKPIASSVTFRGPQRNGEERKALKRFIAKSAESPLKGLLADSRRDTVPELKPKRTIL
jgi:hypothetical protein